MLITQSNNWERGFRKRTLKREFKIGPVSLKFITIALLAIGGLFYLAMNTQNSNQSYQIMELTQNRQELQAQGRDLEVEAARLQSLNTIKTSSESLGLVADQAN